MWQELKRRLNNLANKAKHYGVLFFSLQVLLAPYLVNNVLPQGTNTLEKIYRGVMLALFLMLVAQMLTKVLFRIHFKAIDNVKTDKSVEGEKIRLFTDNRELMRIRTTIFHSNEVEDKLAKK